MWEKLRVVFSIEELWGRGLKGFLNSKIKFTLMLLAIYRIGWHIPLPFINQDRPSPSGEGSNGLTEFIDKVALFAASDLRQATIFWPGNHAVYFRFYHFPAARQCVPADRSTEKRRGKRPKKNQRVYAVSDSCLMPFSELGVSQVHDRRERGTRLRRVPGR